MSLATAVADLKTALEDGESRLRVVLDQHMPALVALAERADSDPLISAAVAIAEDELLPPAAKPILAEVLHRLAYTYRERPAAAQAGNMQEPQPVPAEPAQPEPVPPAEPAAA